MSAVLRKMLLLVYLPRKILSERLLTVMMFRFQCKYVSQLDSARVSNTLLWMLCYYFKNVNKMKQNISYDHERLLHFMWGIDGRGLVADISPQSRLLRINKM